MELYIMHVGLSHPSPFFNNLNLILSKYSDINITFSPDFPKHKTKNGVVYFHRLKRYYDSFDIKSVKSFLLKIDKIKKSGWKVVWTIHNFFPIDRDITKVDEYLNYNFIKKVDLVFTFTKYMQKKAYELYKVNSIVHSAGYNRLDGWFNQNLIDINIPSNAFLFTFVGNISKYKMLDSIIESFNRLKYENVYLLIAGPQNNSYKLDVEKIKNKNIIYRFGFVGDDDWKKIINKTNVFLNIYDLSLESFKYGFFPSNCIQLSKYRKISISPISEIFDELLHKKSLITFDFNNSDGLYEAMKYAIKNKEKLKEIEKKLPRGKYDWNNTSEIIVKEMRKLFDTENNYELDYSIISRGTEKYSKKGYMAVSKPKEKKRKIFDSDHGIKIISSEINNLTFDDKYKIHNVAFSRFELISEIVFDKNKSLFSNANILILGFGSVGIGCLINLLDHNCKNISIYVRKVHNYMSVIIKEINIKYSSNIIIINNLDNVYYDIYIDSTGSSDILKKIFINIKSNSNIFLIGTPREKSFLIDPLIMHRKSLRVIGCHEFSGIDNQYREIKFSELLEKNKSNKVIKKIVGYHNYNFQKPYAYEYEKSNFIEVFKYKKEINNDRKQ